MRLPSAPRRSQLFSIAAVGGEGENLRRAFPFPFALRADNAAILIGDALGSRLCAHIAKEDGAEKADEEDVYSCFHSVM